LYAVTGAVLLSGIVATLVYSSNNADKYSTMKIKKTSENVIKAEQSSTNPLASYVLFVDPNSSAAQQVKAWQGTKPDQAAVMAKLASQSTGQWLTSDTSLNRLSNYLISARRTAAAPVLVIYNIPARDCGRYSVGGATSLDAYKQYINKLAKLIGTDRAIVIIEPDALAGIDATNNDGEPCLTNLQQEQTFLAIQYATTTLKAQHGVRAYIDTGNSARVKDTSLLAERLRKAGIDQADGFSLNVSNFQTTEDSLRYGNAIASHLGEKHFVIDTSRNGVGPYKNPVHTGLTWCNPPGRALGHFPTTDTGQPLVDAYLYIKVPGESDGMDADLSKCFGGPTAGNWWPEYALELINRWPQALQP
jgi:endoglucanase